ncbi:MAG: YdcF family protein [Candidatus Yanofskybacteria bacterium]|nr:YdcF family protein [Candidatus Yanofskybacteria bacterium]
MDNREMEPSKENKEKLAPFQALIVLSKAWREHPLTTKEWKPKLSVDSKMSVLAAGKMFMDGLAGKIIFSGGKTAGPGNPSEAEAMKDYLEVKFPEIPERAIIVEGGSVDTFDQAEKTLHILNKYGLTKVALLTVGYQLPRAEKIFRKAGINIEEGFVSEDQLKTRSSHYRSFVRKWLHSKRHFKKEVEEFLLRSMLFIDTEGKALRTVTKKLRYGNKANDGIDKKTT